MEKIAGYQYREAMRLLWWSVVVAGAVTARAVMFKDTGDPGYNTNAPTGTLTNSGWQYQGQWNSGFDLGTYLGTPIAPRYFIAAKHVGGTVGRTFTLDGLTYHTVAYTDCPEADLRVWKVAETFPRYAPLYTGTNETGQNCVVFGLGTQRGATVIVDGVTNGWKWSRALYDGKLRWGENVVAGLVNGGASYGSLLQCAFDRGGGSNECHLSVGDSSGGLFLNDNGTWKLAGIHLAVDGPFSNAVDGTQFDAALLDKGGLYEWTGSGWTFHANKPFDIPSAFYSTRISAHVAWITSVMDDLPGDDFGITGITITNSDIAISFRTRSNQTYRIEYRDELATGTWQSLTNGVLGTGGIVTVLDPHATVQPQRFYRVGFQ